MVFVEGDDYRQLRRSGDDPAQFRSVVRPAQVPVAPDSVIHQYRGQNFTTSGWIDSVGDANMSINGVSPSTLNGDRAASSDGVDDVGVALGPESIVSQSSSFGIAIVFRSSSPKDITAWGGTADSNRSAFLIQDEDRLDRSLGEMKVFLRDSNKGALDVELANSVCDGNVHLIVINKTSDSNIDFYVDDMSSVAPTQTVTNGFDHTAFSVSNPFNFFTVKEGGFSRFKSLSASLFEFKESPYSQQDRLDLKQRAPGV
jgi:hypothetical protein